MGLARRYLLQGSVERHYPSSLFARHFQRGCLRKKCGVNLWIRFRSENAKTPQPLFYELVLHDRNVANASSTFHTAGFLRVRHSLSPKPALAVGLLEGLPPEPHGSSTRQTGRSAQE